MNCKYGSLISFDDGMFSKDILNGLTESLLKVKTKSSLIIVQNENKRVNNILLSETMQSSLCPRYNKFRNCLMFLLCAFNGYHVHVINTIHTQTIRPTMQNGFVLYRFKNIDFPQQISTENSIPKSPRHMIGPVTRFVQVNI